LPIASVDMRGIRFQEKGNARCVRSPRLEGKRGVKIANKKKRKRVVSSTRQKGLSGGHRVLGRNTTAKRLQKGLLGGRSKTGRV